MTRYTRLARAVSDLKAIRMNLEGAGVVAEALTALGCRATAWDNAQGVTVEQQAGDPPNLAVARDAKIEELSSRGYRPLVVIIRDAGRESEAEDGSLTPLLAPNAWHAGTPAPSRPPSPPTPKDP